MTYLEELINAWARDNTSVDEVIQDLRELARTNPEVASRRLADMMLNSAGVSMVNDFFAADDIVTAATRSAISRINWSLID